MFLEGNYQSMSTAVLFQKAPFPMLLDHRHYAVLLGKILLRKNNMEYLLVYAEMPQKDQSEAHGKFKPYSIFALDHCLRKSGYKGKMLLDEYEIEAFFKNQEGHQEDIDLIGVSSTSFSRLHAIKVIKKLRELKPKSVIVTGGVHFGNCAEESLSGIPEIDIVVRGEGDEVIIDLMQYAQGKKSLIEINGISYRESDGKIISQGERAIVMQLDDLDFMDQSYSPQDFKENIFHGKLSIPAMNILTGRGCPYGCIFCSVSRIKNRKYPVKVVVDKIEEISNRYGVKGVKFQDDSLTLNEAYVVDLCDEILKRKLDIIWWCDSRANINMELLRHMHASGCRYVSVGLETASPRIQKIIGKQISNAEVLRFVKQCTDIGIWSFVFLMTSLPDEKPEDLNQTVEFGKELIKHGACAGGVGAATIFPGTKLENIAKERGVLPGDYSWYKDYYNPLNLEYGQVPYIPLYIENITPEMFKAANRAMLIDYAAKMGFREFLKEAIENLFRRDRTWGEKADLALSIMKQKLTSIKSH